MAMSNCSKCGKLFNRTRNRICTACVEAENTDFDKVVEYIREHGTGMVSEIADATEVDVKKINQWVREGKLKLASSAEAPPKQGCRVCGKPVDGGEICEKCRKKLASGIAAARATTAPSKQPSPAAAHARTPRGGMYSRDT